MGFWKSNAEENKSSDTLETALAQIQGNLESGNFDQAIKSGRIVVERFPKSAKAHSILAFALYQHGDIDEGKEHFIAAAKLGDENSRILLFQNKVDWSDGKIKDSINQAVLVKRSGNFQEAESLLSQLNEQYPYHAGIVMSLGKIKACLGEYEEAINLLSKAAEMYEEYGMNDSAWQYRDQVKTLANRTRNPGDFISYMKAVAANPEFKPKIEPLDAQQNSELKSLIERTPPSGIMDLFLIKLIRGLKTDSGLTRIYGGYNQIEKPVQSGFEMMSMGLMGFEEEEINISFERGKIPFRAFIAIPIDEMDNLLENPAMNDWGFEEQYMQKYIESKTIPVGARTGPDGTTKLRTIVFIAEV